MQICLFLQKETQERYSRRKSSLLSTTDGRNEVEGMWGVGDASLNTPLHTFLHSFKFVNILCILKRK